MPVQKFLDSKRKAKETFRRADAVCFDVDSTLIKEEGIDRLAEFCGAGEEVAKLTVKAMGGSVTFREALKMRLDLINPTEKQVFQFRMQHSPNKLLTQYVEGLVDLLRSQGKEVYLVSGGFRQLIEPFAEYLSIPEENLFCNRLLFNSKGKYSGFDESEPTSESGGKTRVVQELKKKHNVVVMIGDGATDMEASPPADTFIGFGGNVVREKVKHGAPWFTHSFKELLDVLHEGERITHFNGYAPVNQLQTQPVLELV